MKIGFIFLKEVSFLFVKSQNPPAPFSFQYLDFFSLVTLTVKGRRVFVKGPKGEITKDYRHMPVELTIKKQNIRKRKGQYLNLKMWFAGKKQACSVSTLKSLIRNMITGVTDVSRTIQFTILNTSLLN